MIFVFLERWKRLSTQVIPSCFLKRNNKKNLPLKEIILDVISKPLLEQMFKEEIWV